MSSQAAAGWAGTAGIVLLGIGIPVALLIVVILLVKGGEWFRGKPKAQLVFWSLLGLFYIVVGAMMAPQDVPRHRVVLDLVLGIGWIGWGVWNYLQARRARA